MSRLGRPEAADLFVVECPLCRTHAAVGHGLVGREVGCPACRGRFLVPAPDAPSEPRVAETATSGTISSPIPTPADAPVPTPVTAALGTTTADDAPIAWGEPPLPSTRTFREPRPASPTPTVTASPTVTAATTGSDVPEPREIDASGVAPPDAGAAPEGLALREPVKTIRVGGAEIELRRLSPEELRIRRGRRNLVILVVGAALLVAFVVILTSGRR